MQWLLLIKVFAITMSAPVVSLAYCCTHGMPAIFSLGRLIRLSKSDPADTQALVCPDRAVHYDCNPGIAISIGATHGNRIIINVPTPGVLSH